MIIMGRICMEIAFFFKQCLPSTHVFDGRDERNSPQGIIVYLYIYIYIIKKYEL